MEIDWVVKFLFVYMDGWTDRYIHRWTDTQRGKKREEGVCAFFPVVN